MSKPEPAISGARRGSATPSDDASSFTTSSAGDPEKNLSALDVSAAVLKGLHPNDPLLWTKWKKLTVLAVLCYVTFLTDFLAGYSVPMTIAQQKEWRLSYVDASRNLSGNTFTQGFGSLLAVPFSMRFGIMPVMFWSGLATWLMTMMCAVAQHWIGYIAVRVLQGIFSAPAQVLGLLLIQEIFVFQDHADMIGIWGWSILLGPYGGPLISAFVLRSLSWRESWWLISGFVGLGVILTVLIMDESAWDRRNIANNPPRPAGWAKRRVQMLSGVMGYRAKGRVTISQGVLRIWSVFKRPQFFLLFLYHGLTYMWSVGINGVLISYLTPAPPAGYGFSTTGVGLIYFAPISAIIVGELIGHFVNDFIQTRTIRRNNGLFEPEARLWAIYPSVALMPLSLTLLGVALKNHWHWFIVAFTWGLFIFTAMVTTVAVTAYILDCFPEDAAPASALLNFTRVLFGFLVPWFQNPWVADVGVMWTYTTQGLVCVAAFALIPVVQWKGKGWRKETAFSPDIIRAE